MNYQQAIDYLFDALPMYQRIGSSAYKADLKNALMLDEYFSHPHRKFRSIHVAGTNGKGSVCHMLASVFQTAGYKTGLYTSPHLLDFRERIRINGSPIEKNFVTEFTHSNLNFFKNLNASFFEMTVFMAFDYFAQNKVDIAIIEVGLGGRLDTTNIIFPELSIITNIGLDHTQFLGNDLETIAGEKAGIIKPKIPVVIGKTQTGTKNVFMNIAKKNGSRIVFADRFINCDYHMKNIDQTIRYHFSKDSQTDIEVVETDLRGVYQEENIITALASLNILSEKNFSISKEAIIEGFRNVVLNTSLLGRWQEVDHNPLVVCDTAHNAEGFNQVISQITNTPYQTLFMILGFVKDKLIDGIVSQLPPDAYYLLVEPKIPRAKSNEEVIPIFRKFNLKAETCDSISNAFENATQYSSSNDLIFIGGSTFLVADFLSWKNI